MTQNSVDRSINFKLEGGSSIIYIFFTIYLVITVKNYLSVDRGEGIAGRKCNFSVRIFINLNQDLLLRSVPFPGRPGNNPINENSRACNSPPLKRGGF